MFIKVYSEWDICGAFGGNNDEDVYEVDDNLTPEQIDDLVLKAVGHYLPFQELELGAEESIWDTGLLGWEPITIIKLGE
jgi:hypothetical protein